MIRIFFIATCFFSMSAAAQPTNYKDWLTPIPEIKVGDSLILSLPATVPAMTSGEQIRNYILPLYTEASTNQSYFLAGKITSGKDYDIVFLYCYSFYSDSLWIKNYYLCTMSKTGALLHFTSVAEHLFDPKLGNRESSSCYYKDGSFITTMKGELLKQHYQSRRRYAINHHGIVIPDPVLSPGADHQDPH